MFGSWSAKQAHEGGIIWLMIIGIIITMAVTYVSIEVTTIFFQSNIFYGLFSTCLLFFGLTIYKCYKQLPYYSWNVFLVFELLRLKVVIILSAFAFRFSCQPLFEMLLRLQPPLIWHYRDIYNPRILSWTRFSVCFLGLVAPTRKPFIVILCKAFAVKSMSLKNVQ